MAWRWRNNWLFRNCLQTMSLSKKIISAGRWTTFVVTSKFLLHYLQLVILSRVLSPEDFGVAAVITSIVTIASVISDFGINNAIIHFPKPSSTVLSSLYCTNIIFAFLISLVLILCADLATLIYENPLIKNLVLLASLIFPLNALSSQFRILAEKELEFFKLSIIEFVSLVVSFCSAVALSIFGYGPYSIILANVIFALVRSALILYHFSNEHKPSLILRPQLTKKYIKFGLYKMGESLLNTLNNQLDIILGAYYSSTSNLALYSIPKELCLSISNTLINPIVTRVSLPAMSKMQYDLVQLKNFYSNVLKLTSALNYPIYVYTFFFSKDLIDLVLGKAWSGSETFLSIFSIWGLIRSTGNPTGSLLYSTGRVRRAFIWNACLLLVSSSAICLTMYQGGMFELAICLLLIQIAIFYPSWRMLVLHSCGMTFTEFIRILAPTFITALSSVGLGYLFVSFFSIETSILRLAYGFLISTLLYLAFSYWLNDSWIALLKLAIKRHQP